MLIDTVPLLHINKGLMFFPFMLRTVCYSHIKSILLNNESMFNSRDCVICNVILVGCAFSVYIFNLVSQVLLSHQSHLSNSLTVKKFVFFKDSFSLKNDLWNFSIDRSIHL